MQAAALRASIVVTQPRESLGARVALIERCEEALRGRSGVVVRGHVPGRIEVLGKHVDYAGGRSIVCAVERGIAFAAVPRRDDVLHAIDVISGESREARLDAAYPVPHGDWAAYVAAVARRVARDFPTARIGVDVAFASDLPPASGLSSSSALLIMTFLALAQVNASFDASPLGTVLRHSAPTTLADYLAAVESGRSYAEQEADGGVGTLGGSQDHAAILCCRRAMLSRFSYLPTRHLGDHIVDEDLTLAVAFSGVHAQKTGSVRDKYNRAAQATQDIVRIYRERTGGGGGVQSLHDIIAAGPEAVANLRGAIGRRHELQRRLDHFVAESGEIHDTAVAALVAHDWERFGDAVGRSQRAADEVLGNQLPETVGLAHSAKEEGALAASAFGAGFGGSVWALVPTLDAARFLERWRAVHARRFPAAGAHATFFVTRPADAAQYIA